MAMALGNPEGGDDEVVSAINTTPLVDVMLVLLIIFLITIPVVTHTVPVKLPNEIHKPYKVTLEDINLAVNKEGDMFWNEDQIPDTDTLLAKLKEVAVQNPQPELHIRGDQQTQYKYIGKVIFTAQRAGIAKIGFITQPPAKN